MVDKIWYGGIPVSWCNTQHTRHIFSSISRVYTRTVLPDSFSRSYYGTLLSKLERKVTWKKLLHFPASTHIVTISIFVSIRFHQDGKDNCFWSLFFSLNRRDASRTWQSFRDAKVWPWRCLHSCCLLVRWRDPLVVLSRWLIHFRSTSGSRSPIRPTTCQGCPQQNGVLQPEVGVLWMFQVFLNVVLWCFLVLCWQVAYDARPHRTSVLTCGELSTYKPELLALDRYR